MTKNVAIFISGGGSNMMALVQAMKAPNFDAKPALVLSNERLAVGLTKAKLQDIPTVVVDHRQHGKNRMAFEEAIGRALKPHDIDIICLAGFMRILSAGFINNWRHRMLNIHPSLLPKYKGLDTHQRAIDAGDKIAGCSVHEVTAELDGGPVLEQASVPVRPNDTGATLAARVLVEEHRIYPKVLRTFAARPAPSKLFG